MRKCDVCSDTFDKSFLALSLMFGDSGLICHHLRGGRDQWDDSFKAAANWVGFVMSKKRKVWNFFGSP